MEDRKVNRADAEINNKEEGLREYIEMNELVKGVRKA